MRVLGLEFCSWSDSSGPRATSQVTWPASWSWESSYGFGSFHYGRHPAQRARLGHYLALVAMISLLWKFDVSVELNCDARMLVVSDHSQHLVSGS